jgi:signal transduction histidine kinase
MQTEKQNIIIAILTGTAFILLFGFFTFLIVLNYVKRKRKLLLEKQIREGEFQQELLHAQLEMQEHTFRTISQEIHDNVGQILSLAKVNLNILTLDGKGPEQLLAIKELVTSAITELRNLTSGYYADRLSDVGLVVAIRNQLEQLDKTGLFVTSFQSEVNSIPVDRNKTIFLYRMVQEALNNVVKHSGADRVMVDIRTEGGDIHITISDNGKGFNAQAADFKPGIGLSSIQQRATMIGAIARINSEKDKGTTVHLACKPDAYD